MRLFARTAVPILFLCCSQAPALMGQPSDGPPNILFAISDDQSYPYASAYGDRTARTPAFDRLAREGVLFTNAFVASPSCSPSRAALLTGRFAWQLEHAGNFASTFPAKYKVYPDLLEEAGYFVGFTGKGWGPGDWAISGRLRNPAGTEFNKRTMESPAGISAGDYAGNFAEFLAARPEGRRFCFWYGGREPHRSYKRGIGAEAGKGLADAAVPAFLPDVAEVRSDILDYSFEIEWFDQHLGRMIELIEKAGELDNTIIVVTSDNGMPFPRAKSNVYEYGAHVPLVLRWGAKAPSGRVVEDLVSFIDLAPTFLEAADVAGPEALPMTGRSFLNILLSGAEGVVDASRQAVYISRERHASARIHNYGYPQRAIRTREYLYVRNFEPDFWPAGQPRAYRDDGTLSEMHEAYFDIDASPSKSFLIDNRDDPKFRNYFDMALSKRPAEELYDIRKDPSCVRNLAADPAYEDIRQQLQDRLTQHLWTTGDARIRGHGAVFRTYERISPSGRFPDPTDPNPPAQISAKIPSIAPQVAGPKTPALTIELSAGKHERPRAPVFFKLPESLQGPHYFSLTRADTNRQVDVQRLPGRPDEVVWILEEPLAAGETRRYRLAPVRQPPEREADVVAQNDGKFLRVRVGGKPVLVYNQATLEAPPGLDAYYRRSGYIHPLYNPSGQIVTDDFAPDHAHQHGVFFAWVNTTFEGRDVDFWNQKKQEGDVEHVAIRDAVSGNVFAQFLADLRHFDRTAPAGSKGALKETWTVRVYDLDEHFLIDIESEQRTAGSSPLRINEYHYGGMAVRGARQWVEQPESDFLTDEGKTRKDGNHSRPRWAEIHGLIDGSPTGIAVMSDPANFRFPQPVRLNPNRPYFCFSPMVLGEFHIEPGQVYRSKYRFYVHDGAPDAAANNRIWNDYTDPVLVRIVE